MNQGLKILFRQVICYMIDAYHHFLSQEATYSIDGDRNVIIGLPPPRNNNSITVRNYRLTESLVDAALKVSSFEMNRRISIEV